MTQHSQIIDPHSRLLIGPQCQQTRVCPHGAQVSVLNTIRKIFTITFPENTTRRNEDVLMLVQRLRRWPNIKTSFFQRIVFAGLCVYQQTTQLTLFLD